MSSYNLNSNKSIAPYQNEGNTIKISQSNEVEHKQDSVYKFIKKNTTIEENYNYREISTENNQFQIFNLDSNKLREIFVEHGEQIIKRENNNSSMKILEEENFQD